ncbi:hypothetical protein [Marinifilum sp.]|uniref:hypothetical protein n=1 Tax=Marinifilum sp. TaxID=2033137 RepID=UPI003BABC7B1
MNDRNALYSEAIKILDYPSKNNIQILKTHLFLLKVNDDYVINSSEPIDDLVSFINGNHGK